MESADDLPEPGNTGQIYLAPATSTDEIKLLQAVYPVGAIYLSTVAADPATLFGFGTWERVKDVFLLAAGDTYAAGATGGEATHTLTVDEMPKHTHGSIYTGSSGTKNLPWLSGTGSNLAYVGGYTGGDAAHNNMPPYLAVYMWKRTA